LVIVTQYINERTTTVTRGNSLPIHWWNDWPNQDHSLIMFTEDNLIRVMFCFNNNCLKFTIYTFE